MAEERAVIFIKQLLAQGKSIDEAKKQLLSAGWLSPVVEEAATLATIPQQIQTNPQFSPPIDISQTVIKETTKIKIVAIWFILKGTIGIIIALILGVITLPKLVISAGSLELSLLAVISMSLLVMVSFIFLSFILFRISSALHKLEIEGYQAACICLIAFAAGSIAFIPINIFILKEPNNLFSSLPLAFIEGIMFFLLRVDQQLFQNDAVKSLKVKIIVALVFMLLLIPVSLFVQTFLKKDQNAQLKAAMQEVTQSNRQKNPEPTAINWSPYTNTTYNFTLNIPNDWNNKEYPVSYNPGKEIAFDPSVLPDARDHFHSPYIDLVVFPTSNQTYYKQFQDKLADLSRKSYGYKKAVLGGETGVDSGREISVEHEGYVYQLTARLIEDDNLNYNYSDISQKVISSFSFTK